MVSKTVLKDWKKGKKLLNVDATSFRSSMILFVLSTFIIQNELKVFSSNNRDNLLTAIVT